MSDPKDDLVERAAAALDRGVTPTERLELLDLVAKWSALSRSDTSICMAVVGSCADELRAVMARHGAGKGEQP